MQNTPIYSAPSLAEVLKHLMAYRLTGILTLKRAAADDPQESVHISIEQGQAKYVQWGFYEEDANVSILTLLNTWGQIHFTFQIRELPLRIPAKSSQALHPHSPEQRARPDPLSPITRPLAKASATTSSLAAIPHRPASKSASQTAPLKKNEISSRGAATEARFQQHLLPGVAPEVLIPLHTPGARNYPIHSLARYDRTIFLLINGQRTVSDLAHLTKRSLEQVYTSLYRLRDQRLITVQGVKQL